MLATPELLLEIGQSHRLDEILPLWLREVPVYRRALERMSSAPVNSPVDQLRRLPLLTKADIRRDFPHNFLPAGAELEDLLDREVVELEQTSGTSEERTALLLPLGWWSAQEARALRLNPIVDRLLHHEPNARRVTLSSPVCSGDICYRGVPTRTERIVGNALFLSLSRYPFLWSQSELARMAAEAVDWRPRFLDVDPVYGVNFALYCERFGMRLPSLEFIICSYEFVSLVHRRILQRVFGVPVFDLYGSTETGHLLMEDERGQMRPSLETAVLELLEPDAAGIGELVVTTLTNDFMPLLRYRIGDLVQRIEQPYGTRYLVHGRSADAFRTSAGRRVSVRQVDGCFADIDGVAHYQLLQLEGPAWLLRFVTDGPGPSAAAKQRLQQQLTTLLEAGTLTLQETELLVPESSGKFRLGYPQPAIAQ